MQSVKVGAKHHYLGRLSKPIFSVVISSRLLIRLERSNVLNASALSTEIIVRRRVLSTAYLSLPLAVWISNDRWSMGIACAVAFVVSFCGTLVSNAVSWCKR